MRVIPMALVLGVLTGCITVNHTLLSDAHLGQPIPASEVRIYFADDSIPDYERVAILSTRGYERDSEQEMLDIMRVRAGALGANAIILQELRDPTGEEKIASALSPWWMTARQRGRALAIWVKGKTTKSRGW